MVGRLVQHQKVRLQAENLRQMCPHDPAPRHFVSRPVEILLLESEARKNFPGLRLQLESIHQGKLILRFRIFL